MTVLSIGQQTLLSIYQQIVTKNHVETLYSVVPACTQWASIVPVNTLAGHA